MEYISIGKSKLMITLSKEDMREYGIPERGGSGEENTERLRKMLNKIEKNTGFEVMGLGVEVRCFPSKCGGCELYLFRSPCVENGRRIYEAGKTVAERSTERKAASAFKINTIGEKRDPQPFYADDFVVYRFEKLEDAALLCKRLNACKYRGRSDLYYIKNSALPSQKHYYLITACEMSYANEYNGAPASRKFYYFVKEHGRLICRDAVAVLPALF